VVDESADHASIAERKGWVTMRAIRLGGIIAAFSLAGAIAIMMPREPVVDKAIIVPPKAPAIEENHGADSSVLDAGHTAQLLNTIEAEHSAELPSTLGLSFEVLSVVELPTVPAEPPPLPQDHAGIAGPEQKQAKHEREDVAAGDYSSDARPPKRNLTYLAYYAYSEYPPDEKPADLVLDSLMGTAVGTAIEEIKRAADAFGINFNFMKAVAKIESDFDPKQRTGSYIGLFQLSHYEFGKYGSGEITSARDNAIAAAYKFVTEATLFEWETHRKPTYADLYLIHQQGWQGAAEHVAHPERIAWKSMCATDEGKEKGEKWCKRAVWQNTLPAVKAVWKTVDDLTSSAFVEMWRDRVNRLYERYSDSALAP
jgi:hypothetical protein